MKTICLYAAVRHTASMHWLDIIVYSPICLLLRKLPYVRRVYCFGVALNVVYKMSKEHDKGAREQGIMTVSIGFRIT